MQILQNISSVAMHNFNGFLLTGSQHCLWVFDESINSEFLDFLRLLSDRSELNFSCSLDRQQKKIKQKSLKKEKKGFHICLTHKSRRDGKAEKCSGLLATRASVMVSRMRKHLWISSVIYNKVQLRVVTQRPFEVSPWQKAAIVFCPRRCVAWLCSC